MKTNRRVRGKIFVISGPSGSGKTSLANQIIKDKKLKGKLIRTVSFTTRKKRTGEREGKDYFFISASRFQGLRRSKKILEWTKYLGYYYATPKDFVEEKLRAGRHLISCLDLKGALRLKKLYPQNTVTVFVLPPSLEELRSRISKRCSKIQHREIHGRLALANKELNSVGGYDYKVMNKNLDLAAVKLKNIILNKISGKGENPDDLCAD